MIRGSVPTAVAFAILLLYFLCSICPDRLVSSIKSPHLSLNHTDFICDKDADHKSEHACNGLFSEHVPSGNGKILGVTSLAALPIAPQNQMLDEGGSFRLQPRPHGCAPPSGLQLIKLRI